MSFVVKRLKAKHESSFSESVSIVWCQSRFTMGQVSRSLHTQELTSAFDKSSGRPALQGSYQWPFCNFHTIIYAHSPYYIYKKQVKQHIVQDKGRTMALQVWLCTRTKTLHLRIQQEWSFERIPREHANVQECWKHGTDLIDR